MFFKDSLLFSGFKFSGNLEKGGGGQVVPCLRTSSVSKLPSKKQEVGL